MYTYTKDYIVQCPSAGEAHSQMFPRLSIVHTSTRTTTSSSTQVGEGILWGCAQLLPPPPSPLTSPVELFTFIPALKLCSFISIIARGQVRGSGHVCTPHRCIGQASGLLQYCIEVRCIEGNLQMGGLYGAGLQWVVYRGRPIEVRPIGGGLRRGPIGGRIQRRGIWREFGSCIERKPKGAVGLYEGLLRGDRYVLGRLVCMGRRYTYQ